RGTTIGQIGHMIKEGNPALAKDIDGDKLVSSVFWRGQHLVLAVCPVLYHRLAAGGEGKTRLVLNHLCTRWQTSRMPSVCFRCAKIGHIGPSCPFRQDASKARCTRCAAFGHERQACPAQAGPGAVRKCANCLDFNASNPDVRVHRKVDHECTDGACESLAAFARRQWT
ncbi:hypothetical protein FOL47_005720, partial [Perkinsus chesapeaki]